MGELRHIRLFGVDIYTVVQLDEHQECPTIDKESGTRSICHDADHPVLALHCPYDNEASVQPISMVQQHQQMQESSNSTAIVVCDISFQDPMQEVTKSSGGSSKKRTAACDRDSTIAQKKRRRTRSLIPIDAIPLNAVALAPSEELDRKIRSLGGTEMNMVIRKKLTETDCDKGQARLLMPWIQSYMQLTKPERELLNSRDEASDRPNKIIVDVIDPWMSKWILNLKKWKSTSRSNYALCCGWNGLVKANRLKKDDVLEVWSFRVQGSLTFAISR